MKKNILGKLIIFLIIIILIISGVIVILLNNSSDLSKENKDSGEYDPPSEPIYTKAFNTKMQIPDYFAIKNIIEKYLSFVEYVNGEVEFDESMVQNVKETKQKFVDYGLNAIKDILDERYISEFNVDNNNIINSCKKYSTEKNSWEGVYIDDIYASSLGANKLLCLVKFTAKDCTSSMLVVMDVEKLTFSLFLSDYIEKYNYNEKMTEENINIKNVDIAKNENNTFGYLSASDETLAKEYLRIYKNLILNQNNKLYDLLEEKYKAKRFSNIQEYQKYVNDIRQRTQSIILYKYRVEDDENGNKTFYLLDNYNNVYIVIRDKDDITKFKYRLDDYTIKTDEFLNEYNNSTDEKKVSTNISEFISCINTKNYKTAYDRLNDTFKNTNFGSLEKFEAFMKNNLYDNNIIQSAESIEKNGAYYVCKIVIKNGQNQETKTMTIVMQLLENLDYQMSFSF